MKWTLWRESHEVHLNSLMRRFLAIRSSLETEVVVVSRPKALYFCSAPPSWISLFMDAAAEQNDLTYRSIIGL